MTEIKIILGDTDDFEISGNTAYCDGVPGIKVRTSREHWWQFWRPRNMFEISGNTFVDNDE